MITLALSAVLVAATPLIDLSQKVKASGTGVVKTDGKLFAVGKNGQRVRINKKPSKNPRQQVKAWRVHQRDRYQGVVFETSDDDAPSADTKETKEVDENGLVIVSLPKKVKKWKSYWYPLSTTTGDKPPKSGDNKSKQSAVRSQGSVRGTCSAFASMASLETGSEMQLSTEYAFWLFNDKKKKAVCDVEEGADVDEIASALEDAQVPPENTWAYKESGCPNEDAPEDAKKRAGFGPRHIYVLGHDPAIRVGGDRTMQAGVNDPLFLEAVIAAGYSPVFGFLWPSYDGFYDDLCSGDVVDVKLDGAKNPYGTDSGHFMVAVGYERSEKKNIGGGYFVFKNSYGTDCGKDGYVKLSYDFVRQYGDDGVIFTGASKVDTGGPCAESSWCAGFESAGNKGAACCDISWGLGTCQKTQKDHAGVYYCPSVCVGRSGASAGTCGADGLADDGEACKVNADCQNFTSLGQNGSACCSGTCAELQQDFAGVYYCPSECKASVTAKPGSCKDGDDSACKTNADCKGFKGLGKEGDACCNGKCKKLKKDFAGVYYCKDECVGASGASAGTCPLKKKNEACKVSADCAKGRTCCSGKCKNKKEDWAGVKYCPEECVGSFGGKRGTCN